MVNRTPTRDRIKLLLAEANELDISIRSLSRRKDLGLTEMEIIRSLLEECKTRLLFESETLRPLARLEDTSIFKVKKHINKKKNVFQWFTSCPINGKYRNIYLGSCTSMDEATAMKKARKLKAEALGVLLELETDKL